MGYQILQLDDDFNIVKEWNCSIKEIAESPIFKTQRTSFDQALRKKMKAHGYYWMFRSEYDLGIRPPVEKQKRNKVVYAYLPQLAKKLVPREAPLILGYTFISAYKNCVVASEDLNISVSNIRCVCDGKKLLHKGYYFSYTPLNPEDEIYGAIQIIEKRIVDGEGDYDYWVEELKKAKEKIMID